MNDQTPGPEINMSQIRMGGGVAGLIFTLGSMAIFLLGVPVLWYFFALAVGLGLGFAVIFHFAYR